METQIKALIAAFTLGTLIAASAFVQSANAQRLGPARERADRPANAQHLGPARERAIRKCMVLQNRFPHEPWGGGVEFQYQACMAAHGQQG
jgi:hypothetical protein